MLSPLDLVTILSTICSRHRDKAERHLYVQCPYVVLGPLCRWVPPQCLKTGEPGTSWRALPPTAWVRPWDMLYSYAALQGKLQGQTQFLSHVSIDLCYTSHTMQLPTPLPNGICCGLTDNPFLGAQLQKK